MKKIVLSASYFGVNLGDEAILRSIITLIYKINSTAEVVVLAWDKEKVKEMHKNYFNSLRVVVNEELGGFYQLREFKKLFCFIKTFISILNCNYFIWGGGGIINNEGYFLSRYLLTLKLAILLRKPVFIFGVGVQKINNVGLRWQLVHCLNKSKLISVRDENSKANLISMGVLKDIYVVSDPAFLYEKTDNFTCKNNIPASNLIKVGLNLRPWFNRIVHGDEDRKKWDIFVNNFSQFIIKLKKELNIELFFFPFDLNKDQVVCVDIQKKIGTEIKINFQRYTNLDQMVCQLCKMDLFIGMRLHSLIFCIKLAKPFWAISYTEKTENLLNKINYNSIKIDDFAATSVKLDNLVSDFKKIIEEREVIKQSLIKNKNILLKEAELNKILLNKFLYGQI